MVKFFNEKPYNWSEAMMQYMGQTIEVIKRHDGTYIQIVRNSEGRLERWEYEKGDVIEEP
jgi:hypothetical protein